MRYIILLVALLSCSEEELTPCKKYCFNMIISDAIPIQFWVNGEETFNEKAVCGIIKQDCFCQPFECDDEIRIQAYSFTGLTVNLEVIGSNESIIFSLPFFEISSGVYEVSFVPSQTSPSICEDVRLIINVTYTILNDDFDSTLDGWTNDGLAINNWAWSSDNGGCAKVSFTEPSTAKDLKKSVTFLRDDLDYNFVLNYLASGGFASLSILFHSNTNGVIYTLATLSTGTTSNVIPSSIIADTDFITIKDNSNGSGVTYTYRILSIDFYVNIDENKSDCLSLKESHECTKLISYSNASDFDGIVYTDASPTPTFYLRIPATFHEQENPQEQEDLELSNGVIVTLRQSIQEKTLLETGYMPNYMHKKLQKVLMHETIEIDGDNWKRRDTYETNPIKKYNLKRGSVLLTKYNSILKNTI